MKCPSLVLTIAAAAGCAAEVHVDHAERALSASEPSAWQDPSVYPVTVLLVRIDEGAGYPIDTRAMMVARLDELAAAFEATSGGRVALELAVLDEVTLPSSLCVDEGPGVYGETQRNVIREAVRAVDDKVDFSQVRHLIVHVDAAYNVCQAGNSGWERLGWKLMTGEGRLDVPVAIVSHQYGTSPLTLIHEYAHSLGAVHNECRICRHDGVRVAIDHSETFVHFGNCPVSPPGSLGFDPMSNGGFHFNAPHKMFWGWIAPSEIVTITSSGIYEIAATEFPQDGRPRALRVPLPASQAFESYVLELRSASPLWDHDLEQTPGVYLHAKYRGAWPKAFLVEPPPFASETSYTTKPLAPGVPYTDDEMNVTITVLGPSGDGRQLVAIDIGPPGA